MSLISTHISVGYMLLYITYFNTTKQYILAISSNLFQDRVCPLLCADLSCYRSLFHHLNSLQSNSIIHKSKMMPYWERYLMLLWYWTTPLKNMFSLFCFSIMKLFLCFDWHFLNIYVSGLFWNIWFHVGYMGELLFYCMSVWSLISGIHPCQSRGAGVCGSEQLNGKSTLPPLGQMGIAHKLKSTAQLMILLCTAYPNYLFCPNCSCRWNDTAVLQVCEKRGNRWSLVLSSILCRSLYTIYVSNCKMNMWAGCILTPASEHIHVVSECISSLFILIPVE